MVRNRNGFSLFEVMTVIVLTAIMLAVAIPRMSASKQSAALASARAQVESYVNVARAIAVRNGGRTQLIQSGNTLYIQADTGTGWVVVVRPTKFNQSSDVTLTATATTISFDARGVATGLNAAGEKFYLTGPASYGATAKDSVCITRFGALLDRNCGAAVPSEVTVSEPPPIIISTPPIITVTPY